MEEMFKKFWKLWIFNVNILQKDADNYSMYTFMPFSNSSCNNTKPILINSFDKINMKWSSNSYFPKKFQNLQGCEIKVGAYKTVPGFIPTESKNGSKTYSGIDVDVLRSLSDILNFKLKIFEKNYGIGYILKNGTITGLLKDAYTKEFNAIIGTATLQLTRMESLSPTKMIYTDFLIIVVPPPFLIDPLTKILMPFSVISWICIFIVIISACCIIFVLKFLPRHFSDYIIGRGIKGRILNIWNLMLGGPLKKLPSTNFPRFLLMNFLLFAMIMRTLYQAALFKLLKEEIRTPEMERIDDFVENNFTFFIYESLAAYSNGSKFMQNHNVIKLSEIPEYSLKTFDPHFKGVVFSFFTSVLSKNNENRENFTLKICKEFVHMNQIVFYFTKNFYLVDEANRVIEEMRAAGILDKIISKYINMRSLNSQFETHQAPSPLNFGHLEAIFETLLYGLTLASICFLVEIIVKKYF